MLKTFAAAVIAASLIAGPVLAQGTSVAPANATIQPAAKADSGKTAVKTDVKADACKNLSYNFKTGNYTL